MSEEDIEDKSKGNMFAKGIAVLHTGCFIIQCVARGAQGLDATELEIIPVGFAVYLKPESSVLDEKRRSVEAILLAKHLCNSRTFQPPSPARQNRPILETESLPIQEERLPVNQVNSKIPAQIHPISFSEQEAFSSQTFGPFFIVHPESSVHSTAYHSISLLDNPFADMATQLTVEAAYNRVPTFYACRVSASIFAAKAVSKMVLVGICYGAVHCTAWAFPFPFTAERVLWRVASIALLGVPVYLFILIPFIGTYDKRPNIDTMAKWAAGFGFVVYVVANGILLVLSFTSLRSLPPSLEAEWTRYIPHLGSSS
ncbi:unnamed protein product [Cyclocybe aegerita]|uniref:Uncharacterized protein n=1 Tax=Cyclocybe aegerita TaxID=1973307 RepID=A0A8S0X9X0_CYCAE|nr:unnamed protein product [Cyclocybe aegerita]